MRCSFLIQVKKNSIALNLQIETVAAADAFAAACVNHP